MLNTSNNQNTSGNPAPVLSDADVEVRVHSTEPSEPEVTPEEFEAGILAGLEAFGIV